jgi:hypothetical protein
VGCGGGQLEAGAGGAAGLYLDDLRPTGPKATTIANPGIVLAYRLGEGSSAEIWASFGTWGGDGELGWSQAVQLTKDQVDDQDFALVEGEAGGFALVVQKKEAGTASTALLEQLKTARAMRARRGWRRSSAAFGQTAISMSTATRLSTSRPRGATKRS